MKEEVYIEMNTKKPGTYLDREQRKQRTKVLLLRKFDPQLSGEENLSAIHFRWLLTNKKIEG